MRVGRFNDQQCKRVLVGMDSAVDYLDKIQYLKRLINALKLFDNQNTELAEHSKIKRGKAKNNEKQ
jgi:hypothetical protein